MSNENKKTNPSLEEKIEKGQGNSQPLYDSGIERGVGEIQSDYDNLRKAAEITPRPTNPEKENE